MPTLAKKEECTGCSACTNICPKKCLQMEIDKEGFLYPFLKNTEACVECGMCGMVCPVHGNLEIQNVETQAYAAYTKDSDIRKSSSSGGIAHFLDHDPEKERRRAHAHPSREAPQETG